MRYIRANGWGVLPHLDNALSLQWRRPNYDNNKIIPIVCGIAGGVLGVAGMYLMPDFPASDPITAVAVGIVSGLAATGADQIVKQVKSNTQ